MFGLLAVLFEFLNILSGYVTQTGAIHLMRKRTNVREIMRQKTITQEGMITTSTI